jgi:hypothetical protein
MEIKAKLGEKAIRLFGSKGEKHGIETVIGRSQATCPAIYVPGVSLRTLHPASYVGGI